MLGIRFAVLGVRSGFNFQASGFFELPTFQKIGLWVGMGINFRVSIFRALIFSIIFVKTKSTVRRIVLNDELVKVLFKIRNKKAKKSKKPYVTCIKKFKLNFCHSSRAFSGFGSGRVFIFRFWAFSGCQNTKFRAWAGSGRALIFLVGL